jgi:hypothetical protein
MIALLSGVLPALPLHTAGKYVAGAFIVLFAMVLIYVSIMAIRLSRLERELGELLELSERAEQDTPAPDIPEPRESALAYPIEGHQ